MKRKLLTLLPLALLFIVAAVIVVQSQRSRPSDDAAAPKTFSLVNQKNEPVTAQTYRGTWALVFFGYTHCPDICPTTLADLGKVLKTLGPDVPAVQVLFVTLDPERDTPPVMADYLANFEPGIVGLTGTPEQVAAVAKTFGVYYAKVDSDEKDYALNHSAALYLLAPDGRYVRPFTPDVTSDTFLAKLRAVLADPAYATPKGAP